MMSRHNEMGKKIQKLQSVVACCDFYTSLFIQVNSLKRDLDKLAAKHKSSVEIF